MKCLATINIVGHENFDDRRVRYSELMTIRLAKAAMSQGTCCPHQLMASYSGSPTQKLVKNTRFYRVELFL